jgi:hypothetical protein
MNRGCQLDYRRNLTGFEYSRSAKRPVQVKCFTGSEMWYTVSYTTG